MDADTRHQLKQNELAEALGRLRSLGDRNFWLWLVIIILIFGGWGSYRLWRSQKEALLATTWSQLLEVNTLGSADPTAAIDQLQLLSADSTDAKLTAAARVRLGGALLSKAVEDADQRDALLSRAEQTFLQVVQSPESPKPLAAAATFALGSVYESQHRLDDAQRVYRELIDDERFADLPYGELAQERLDSFDELREKVVFTPGDPPSATQPASLPSTNPIQNPMGPPVESQPASAPTAEAQPPTDTQDAESPPTDDDSPDS